MLVVGICMRTILELFELILRSWLRDITIACRRSLKRLKMRNQMEIGTKIKGCDFSLSDCW